MNIEEMKVELIKIENKIELLNGERNLLRQNIALAQAKFKIGDRVTYDGAKCVFEITAIKAGYSNEPKYFGAKIKKDGTPSVVSNEIYTWFAKSLRLA